MGNQTLFDILAIFPYEWAASIEKITDVDTLLRKLKNTQNENKKIIIQARIDRLNYDKQ